MNIYFTISHEQASWACLWHPESKQISLLGFIDKVFENPPSKSKMQWASLAFWKNRAKLKLVRTLEQIGARFSYIFFMTIIYSKDFVRLGALQVLSFFRHPCSFILKSTINPIVSPQRELNIEVKYCEYMSKYYKYILEISQ